MPATGAPTRPNAVQTPANSARAPERYCWAELMRRVFSIDVYEGLVMYVGAAL